MIGISTRLTSTLFWVVLLTACMSSNRLQASGQGDEAIETYQEFLEWSADAEIGAQVWLSPMTVRLWPGEHILIFQGPGSSYERCLYVSLTDHQVQEVRRERWSVNEDALDVLIEVSEQTVASGLCSGDTEVIVPTLSVLRVRESH
jgi:hypothetical protein